MLEDKVRVLRLVEAAPKERIENYSLEIQAKRYLKHYERLLGDWRRDEIT